MKEPAIDMKRSRTGNIATCNILVEVSIECIDIVHSPSYAQNDNALMLDFKKQSPAPLQSLHRSGFY